MSSLDSLRKDEIAKYVRCYTDDSYRMGKDRVREWWDYLELLQKDDPEVCSILDVGCGRAESLKMAQSLGFAAHGCEVVEDLCGGNVFPIRGIHDIGECLSGSYDLVACQDVLEHILEDDVPAGLAELVRLARRRVYVSVAWFPSSWKGHDDLHITIHDSSWWVDRLGAAAPGATIRELEPYRPSTARLEVILPTPDTTETGRE